MFWLDEKRVIGTVKVRKGEKTKNIDRKRIKEVLTREMDNEKDLIRQYDYKILIDSIIGIETIFIEKKELKVIYNPETGWRGEGDGTICENNKLWKLIIKIFEENETPKRKGAL